jgi:hypothetical protein
MVNCRIAAISIFVLVALPWLGMNLVKICALWIRLRKKTPPFAERIWSAGHKAVAMRQLCQTNRDITTQSPLFAERLRIMEAL